MNSDQAEVWTNILINSPNANALMNKYRLECSRALLGMLNADENKFITAHETWNYHCDTEAKQDSYSVEAQWSFQTPQVKNSEV